MTVVLFPSPTLLDESFPRNDNELRRVAVALGELQALMMSKRVLVALTPDFRVIAEAYDGNWTLVKGLLRDVRLLIAQIYLAKGSLAVELLPPNGPDADAHPIPAGTDERGYVDFWRENMGKEAAAHAACCYDRICRCAGIACDYAFAGLPKNHYEEPFVRAFMLVGPSELDELYPLYDWDVDANAHNLEVTVEDVANHYEALGAIIHSASGGKHPYIEFPDGRKWPYSKNWKPKILDGKLRQLEQYTGWPLPVIKSALATGIKPGKSRKRECHLRIS